GLVPVTIEFVRLPYRFSHKFHEPSLDGRFATLPQRIEPGATTTFFTTPALLDIKNFHRLNKLAVCIPGRPEMKFCNATIRRFVKEKAMASRQHHRARRLGRKPQQPLEGGE